MNTSFSKIMEQISRREKELEQRKEQLDGMVCDLSEEERDKVIKKGEKDFWFWAKTVFPEYCTKPFSRLHKFIFKVSMSGKRKVYVIAGPPEHGKTIILRLFKIWAAVYGHKHYIIKITETMDLSRIDLASIKLEFENNPRLIFLYGHLKTSGHWDEDAFKVAPTKFNKSGTWFEAFAYGVPPTGRVRQEHRPDFADIDDLENYKKSSNIKISKDKLEFISNDVIPRMAMDAPIIWFGNNARKTMAINIIIEMEKNERLQNYPAFDINVFPAFNVKKKEALWKEVYKFKDEEKMRLFFGVGLMTWMGNYQQNPVVADGLEFKKANWSEYVKLPKDALGIMMCDPASGKTGCFKAIDILLFSREMSAFYTPECFVRQCDWEPYFLAMYELYNRYQKHIRFIGWEKDFHQDQYLLFRKLYPSVKDRAPLPIRPIDVKPFGPKEERIRSLSVPYERGQLKFSKEFLQNRDGMEAQTQLIGFPDYPFVDYADAKATAYKLVFNMFAGFMMPDRENQIVYESIEKTRTSRDMF